jgi:hypothetical protein
MPAITSKDWGRIYAYIWKKERDGYPEYIKRFEQDPAWAVKEVAAELGIDYYDRLYDIEMPKELLHCPEDYQRQQLDRILTGKDPNWIVTLRLTC